MSFAAACRSLSSTPRFQTGVLALIVFNAVVVGLEAVPAAMVQAGPVLVGLDRMLLACFTVEILVRLGAEGTRPARFFRSPWNVFDFAVVAASLVPQVGSFATVARLARVLRVARLMSSVPDLRLIVETMIRSIGSMGHVVLLLGLLLYVYGIVGHQLFADVDPSRWGSLGTAVGTLFQILTLEGWVEIQARSLEASPFAWIFYASFIVVAVFVLTNLFIAVVINNLEAAKAAHVAPQDRDLVAQASELRTALAHLEARLRDRDRSAA